MAPFGGEHDQVQGVSLFYIEPTGPPIACLIRGIQRLRHDAFVSGRKSGFVKGARGGRGRGDESRYQHLGRHSLGERREALTRGQVGHAPLPDAQTVEEKSLHGQLAAQRLYIELAAEAAHGDLKRMRPAIRVECDRLPIELECVIGESPHGFYYLRYSNRHVVETARVETNLIAQLVSLDAGTIHLPLELDLASQLRKCLLDVCCCLGEHRCNWLEH